MGNFTEMLRKMGEDVVKVRPDTNMQVAMDSFACQMNVFGREVRPEPAPVFGRTGVIFAVDHRIDETIYLLESQIKDNLQVRSENLLTLDVLDLVKMAAFLCFKWKPTDDQKFDIMNLMSIKNSILESNPTVLGELLAPMLNILTREYDIIMLYGLDNYDSINNLFSTNAKVVIRKSEDSTAESLQRIQYFWNSTNEVNDGESTDKETGKNEN